MIPEIGLMLGLYIIVRMLQIVSSKTAALWLGIPAVITILVTAICIFDLVVSGSQRMPSF